MTQQRSKRCSRRAHNCGSRRAWDTSGSRARKLRVASAAKRRRAARLRSHSARRGRGQAATQAIATANTTRFEAAPQLHWPMATARKADGASFALETLASRRRTAELLTRLTTGHEPKIGPTRAHADKLTTKIIEGQEKKSSQTQMQTTRSNVASKRSSGRGIKEAATRANKNSNLRGPSGLGQAIRKTTRTRTIRCEPVSLLANIRPLTSSISSHEIPDAIPYARTSGPDLVRAGGARTRSSYAQSVLTEPGAPASSFAASVRQSGSGQSEIDMIVDRLRQKTERARMATTGNTRAQLSAKPNGLIADVNEMELIKSSSRAHQWHWSDVNKSHECVVSKDRLSLCFHPKCSESAAACRGSEPFRRNGNYYYWEIHVQDKIYGTSVMFGLCTKQQTLHANEYCNLVGLDEAGWSLSHKGLAWHGGKSRQYTKMFPINQPITIGLLFNTMRGELSYFMDGKNLGVAFRGLNDIDADLYPIVGSTAKCTRMRLIGSYCGYVSLLERSCFTLLKSSKNRAELVEYLRQSRLPRNLFDYLIQAANVSQNESMKFSAQSTGTNLRPHKQNSQNTEDNHQLSMNESSNMSS